MPGQRGFALIALLSLAALIAAFLIASALNLTSAGISNEREQRSMNALRQAKAALIAYAASEQWQLYKTPSTYFQPGALPCPDQDDDGDADCFGSNTASMIGRVPFKTLGIDDLRDASGERLWYALSHDFRKMQCSIPPSPPIIGCTTINSDTLGQLTVTGTAPASNVVAVLFAPGVALSTQNRPSDPTDPAHNSPSNYLEGFDPVNYVFTSNALPSDTFNDRVLVITQAELMAAVEPVVAARIQRDIKPYIQAWSDPITGWGAYPFAAPFAAGGPPANPGRAQAEYKGATGQTNGLLPITTDPNWARWQTSSISITQIPGGTGTGANVPPDPTTIHSIDCSASTTSQISCLIDYTDFSPSAGDNRPAIKLQATLLNAAVSFPTAFKFADASMTDKNGDPLSTDPAFGNWSPTSPTFSPTTSNTALADGTGLVVFTGRLQNPANPPSGTGGRVTITVPVSFHPITNSTDPNSGWFIANQWYRQTYFAVSPGYVPGGGNSCGPLPPAPPCLRVNNLPSSYATSNDKQAILVFAGRALNGTPRPSGLFANYLENANLSAAQGTTPYVYEHRAGVPTSINDRVVVVSP